MRRRIGWALMGYPALIGYGRHVRRVPFWAVIYRLGARLHNA